MKKLLALFACLFILGGPVFSVDVGGTFTADGRVALEDGDFLFDQVYGKLTFEGQVSDHLLASTALSLRLFNNPIGGASHSNVLGVDELSLLYSVEPLEIGLDRAYFTYSDLFAPGLDLTVGKQRIPWGVSDTLNPTDLLNPLDFSDPFAFGKKSASLAALLTYTVPSDIFSIQLVYEPYSHPARLNALMLDAVRANMDSVLAVTGFNLLPDNSGGWTETADTPEFNIKNSLYAAKLSFSVPRLDISANFVSRLNDIPYVKSISFTVDDPMSPTSLEGKAYTFAYYREYECGLDAAWDLGFMVLRAEGALFFPEGDIETTTYLNAMPTATATAVSADPYVKYTVGFDSDLGAGFYLNVQYNHGFFNERGNDGPERLQDYLVVRLELSVLDDTLKFGLTGLGNVNNVYDAFGASDFFTYIVDNGGYMGGFDIEYKPSVSVSLKAGVMLFDGNNCSIARMKDNDLVFASFEYHF
ncbi:MAG: hypothetical protein JXD23_08915 [Spirochaetales bacterium]|nr:hypothetical protein [Spirochaetales bacterium]